MTVRRAFGIARIIFAAVCAVSLVFRLRWGLGSVTATPENFFSYLTIQSNIAYLIVTLIAAVVAFRTADDPRWLSISRATVLSMTLSAGVVFGFLIQQAGARGFRIDVPWSDQILHFWLTAFSLLEWYAAPGRHRVPWRIILIVIAYTVLWGVFTLIRGSIVGWYPYFFLDPQQVGSFAQFALYSGIALTTFSAVCSGVVGVSRTTPLATRIQARVEASARPQR
ncbi:Pr6Pr family membrane protein [Glaciihabitans sp. dw_435]|uniref:Pr6Pr family membrane protein n=1 Tax=Glaciihabitans sp. dw_435 TaxID=2720081 RepID=UPI0027DAB937|nr:Pr6Pr family membrane protein [Glaciihabitans sp. dw_435]